MNTKKEVRFARELKQKDAKRGKKEDRKLKKSTDMLEFNLFRLHFGF